MMFREGIAFTDMAENDGKENRRIGKDARLISNLAEGRNMEDIFSPKKQ
jgi:hypothetical protein